MIKPLSLNSNAHSSLLLEINIRLHKFICIRVKTEPDGKRAETRFGLPAKRTSPFISAGVSVQSSTGFLGVRVGGERL